MLLSIIVAVAENNVIGKDNKLLWHLPADLKFFKQTTLNHTMIMGRKTFESIGKALPGRITIVITGNKNFTADNVIVKHSLKDALDSCKNEGEVFITGGAQIYLEALPYVNKVYLTQVHKRFDGDTYFNPLPESDFKCISNTDYEADEKNTIAFSIKVFERISGFRTL